MVVLGGLSLTKLWRRVHFAAFSSPEQRPAFLAHKVTYSQGLGTETWASLRKQHSAGHSMMWQQGTVPASVPSSV